MKKITMILVGTLLLLGLSACGGDTPEAAMGDMIDLMDGFANGMDSAGNADEVVAVMDKFSDGMQDLVPRFKTLQEKYPELSKGMDSGKMPVGMEQFEEKFKTVMPRLIGASAKMMQYASDPKVQEATKKFQEAMGKMK